MSESEAKPRTPAEKREIFERKYGRDLHAEFSRLNEDGTETVFGEYVVIFNTTNPADRQLSVSDFCRSALQAGYRQAFSPIVIPGIGDATERPVTAVYFYLEKP